MKTPRLDGRALRRLSLLGDRRMRRRRRRRRRWREPTPRRPTQAKASGDVTWCIGKDTSGAFGTVVDSFNKANPKANVKLLELPEAADEQRRLQIQRLAGQVRPSATCSAWT